jgi:exopolysaccharide biosynthesis polyprenyl glycosylphosphotransferase
MKSYYKYLKFLLVFFDIFFYYLSLLILLLLKYGKDKLIIEQHLLAFSFILPFWLFSFYAQNFYSFHIFKNKFSLRVIKAFFFGFIISIIFFYFLPQLRITPKSNLFIFSVIYLSFFIIVRNLVENSFFWSDKSKLKILVILPKNLVNKFKKDFAEINFYDFEIIDEGSLNTFYEDYSKYNAVVISRKIKDEEIINTLIKKINYQIPIIELIEFYEKNLGRIPLEEIDEYWILKEIINPELKFQSLLKRCLDLFLSLIIGILSLPLIPFIALGIYLNSPGPLIFKQERIGKNNKKFVIYKFRTMKPMTDLGIWEKKNDDRIFFFGKILRKLHLDELPQIINVLKGELSFIGPRPEQVNIVKDLEKKIPFYNFRHLILPGITGWTQVNYKKPYDLEETKIKVEYDFYYLKNKNLFLDIIIFLKTIFNI